jgi:dihydropteroate synthase
MGILNVTPDSFYDGGDFLRLDHALAHAEQMIDEGADIIDVGGESTRPGAESVSAGDELNRVLPIIKAIRTMSNVAISIDSSKAEVLEEVARHDIDLINDVRALAEVGALEVIAQTDLPVCLMHMKGEPGKMQDNPYYDDLIEDLLVFFNERIKACRSAGIDASRIILDVGFGFGKSAAHNLELINKLDRFAELGLPLLVGLSRKSTIGKIVDDRLIGSVSGALAAINKGAHIVRVHDVGPTVTAIKVWRSIAAERVID